MSSRQAARRLLQLQKNGAAELHNCFATRAAFAAAEATQRAPLPSRPPSTPKPTSLAVPPSDVDEATAEAGQVGVLRKLALRLGGFYSAESVRVRAALRLQSAVLRAGDDDALREAARLPPDDFRARFALCSLHMWLALVRLRAEGEPGKLLGQEAYDHFWAEQETRVRGEGVVVRLSKWMKELEAAFYGSAAAYDRALTPGVGGEALAGALRRNVYMGEGDPSDVARLAEYIRHQLACLAVTPSADVMAGHIRFGGASALRPPNR